MKERIENLKKALGFTLLFDKWACFGFLWVSPKGPVIGSDFNVS